MHNPDVKITNRAPSGPSWGRERLPSTWLHLSGCHGATLSLKTFDSVRNTSAQGDIYRQIQYIYRERGRGSEREEECVTDRRRKRRIESAPQRERERKHTNTRTKSIRSQYTVDMQYVSRQNLPSPKCQPRWRWSHSSSSTWHYNDKINKPSATVLPAMC